MLHPDSMPIRFLTKVCDLLFLNLVLVLCCATVVFSGAAVISLYAVTLKMIRGDDYDPVKGFLRAVRSNFSQSVPVTLLLFADLTLIAALRAVLYADRLVMPPALFVLLAAAAVLLTALLAWLFPLLARFENTFPRHLGNAARLALACLPVTFFITAADLLPVLLWLFFPSLAGAVLAFWLLFGFALGAWANSFYLNRIFERWEG